MICAWMDYDVHNCAACNDRMRRANGCTEPPRTATGEQVMHAFPPDETMWSRGSPEYTLDTCPMNVLVEHMDVQEIFRAANLATIAPLERQSSLPHPYLEALSTVMYHRDAASAWRAKKRSAERRAVRRG